MNTMQLTCFLTVAETLNFARAAQQLNVTQPAVTQQIHSLEEELNVKLFHRTTRNVELTRSGLIFMSDAKSVLDILEHAKKMVGDSIDDARTAFIIGCHTHHEIYQFSDVLKQMRNQHPNLYPIFHVIPFQHLYQQLAEERVNIVIAFQENDLKKPLLYKELSKIPIIAVMPSNHLLAHRQTLNMNDLKNEKVVIIEPRKCPDSLRKIQHKAAEDKSIPDIYLCDSVESSITLARAGYGIAVVPEIFSLKDPALSYIPIADAEPMSYGVYYKKLSGHPILKTFITIAKELFSALSKDTD